MKKLLGFIWLLALMLLMGACAAFEEAKGGWHWIWTLFFCYLIYYFYEKMNTLLDIK